MSKTFYVKGKKYNCVKNGTPYFRKSAVINGKQRSFYGDGEKDAQRKIDEAKALESKGLDFDKKTARTEDVFSHWLFDVKRVDRNIKASTFTIYEYQFRKFIKGRELGSIPLSSLTPSALQRAMNRMGETGEASGKSIDYFLRLLRQFCRWAMDAGYIIKNPAANITIPGERVKQKKEVETFTEDERRTLLSYMDETGYFYDALIKLAFATGMRQGELLALRWEDIDDDVIHVRKSTQVFAHVDAEGERNRKREVWDTKTAAGRRDIPIIASIQQMLKDLKHQQKVYLFSIGAPQTEYVFVNKNGKMINASNLDASYKNLLKRAGVPYKKFHAIRHTFATEAIRRGVPVKDLQVLMGHTDIATTYIYVHASEETKRSAIELIGEMM